MHDILFFGFQDFGDFSDAEILYGGEQEGLTGARRNLGKVQRGALLPGIGRGRLWNLDCGGTKQLREQFVECDPVIRRIRENRQIGDDGFENGGDVSVARSLSAGKGAGIAAQIRKVRRNPSRKCHSWLLHTGRHWLQ